MNKTKFGIKLLFSALALLTVLAGTGLAAQPVQAGACNQYHTVQRGEYLSMIAKMYRTDWRTLAELNELEDPGLIYAGQRLCVDGGGVIIPNTGSSDMDAEVPTIRIMRVVEDEYVTIEALGFPGRVQFDVLMDEIGDLGRGGIQVDTIWLDADGNFIETFDIPSALHDETRIAIRLEGRTTSWYSYNWFDNRDFRASRSSGSDTEPNDSESKPGQSWAQTVNFGEKADVFLGNAGLFIPASAYSAQVRLARFDLETHNTPEGLSFTQKLLEAGVYQADGDPVRPVYGLIYVYFNLNGESREAYEDGDLHIYGYNEASRRWQACEYEQLIATENRPNGRLACIIQDFGVFGLAVED